MKDSRLIEMKVFRAVVQLGGFTAAAHSLGVSQPFTSRTVANLEKRLGVALLHRSTRGRRLTREGVQFLASCTRILDDIEQAEGQLRDEAAQLTGLIRVNTPLSFGIDQVVPLLPAFLAAHPGLEVKVSLSDTLVNLIDGEIDVAIRMGRLVDSTLVARRLCRLQRVVAATPSYIAQYGEPATPEELVQHNCLTWDGVLDHMNRWPFVDGQRSYDIQAKGRVSSNSGLALGVLLMAGVGISRLAEHIALPAIREGKLKPLLQRYQAVDDTAIYAIYRRERQLVPRVRAFVDYLAAAFDPPPWAG